MNPAPTYDLLGTPVTLRVGDPMVRDEITRLAAGLPLVATAKARLLDLRATEQDRWSLFEDDRLVRAEMDRSEALTLILWRLNRLAAASTTHVVVHAGAVTLGGRAVILSGAMNTGKSTLVAALGRNGFDILSDEHAPIDLLSGRVCPYRLPLQLDPTSMAVLGGLHAATPPSLRDPERVRLLPSEVRKGSEAIAAPPTLVIFPEYRRGAPLALERIGPSEGLRRLAEQTLNLPVLGHEALRVLRRLVLGIGGAYSLVLDDLETACDTLLALTMSDKRYVARPMPAHSIRPTVYEGRADSRALSEGT
ncbi:MAG: hypothetical protein ACRDJ0_09945 [Actinomycetota bacterium]